MKIVSLGNDGVLRQRDQAYLGGTFSLLESLKMMGVGSPKMVYLSGIDQFDSLKGLSTSLDYVSIELLRDGFAIRFKKQNTFKASLVNYTEIRQVKLLVQKCTQLYRGRDQVYYETDIEMLLDIGLVKFELLPSHYKSGSRFFKKPPLRDYCSVEILSGVKQASGVSGVGILGLFERLL